ncbi:hypothetical protein Vafri_6172, partial [Volvox africanus]
ATTTIRPPGARGSDLESPGKVNSRDATEPMASAKEGASVISPAPCLSLIRPATSNGPCGKWLPAKSSSTSLGSTFGTSGFPSLASTLSMPQTANAPISSCVSCGRLQADPDGSRPGSSACGCSVGCSCSRSCGGSCDGDDGEAVTAAPPLQWWAGPNFPWSLAVLAEMAGDSTWRRHGDQPLSPPEFACLACMDAPRECGFLHGGTVHMGLCVQCTSRLPSTAEGALSCPVCRQPVERVIEVVF